MASKRKLVDLDQEYSNTLGFIDAQKEVFVDIGLVYNDADENEVNKSTKAASNTTIQNKKIKKNISIEPVDIECEWNLCSRTISKVEDLMKHLAEHIDTITVSETMGGYVCLWRECECMFKEQDEVTRHVYYHGFHAKLKSIGGRYMAINNMKCMLESDGRNVIPDIPDNLQCMWLDCTCTFSSVQDFYWHVQGHILMSDAQDSLWYCHWKGCSSKVKSQFRLREHTRSHTQEKMIACSNCGSIYCSNTKFSEHIERQLSPEEQQYQCSYCSRKYPNEKFLRNHVRHHINHFKCSQCDMTCPTKSALDKHVKYRHSSIKQHKCPSCNKKFKMPNDLARHLTVHSSTNPYVCIYPDCKYSCRSLGTFNIHVKKKHKGVKVKSHACHICEQKYNEGGLLTRHLINVHDFHWPAGHVRFKYKQDMDGYFRLQTMRYESVDLDQGINNDALDDESVDDPLAIDLSRVDSTDESIKSDSKQYVYLENLKTLDANAE